MQVVRLVDQDGRIRGSYVYMLLAPRGSDEIHIKIGQSDKPLDRLNQLLVACPLLPEVFAVVKLPSRQLATLLERALHKALRPWVSRGEWFQFSEADKPAFNEVWRSVFAAHAMPSWPLKWQKINVSEYQRARQVRQADFRRRYARRGRAYKDFARDSAAT